MVNQENQPAGLGSSEDVDLMRKYVLEELIIRDSA